MKRSRVILLVIALFVPSVSYAADGSLFMSPSRGAFPIDEVFEIDVRADTGGMAANAAEADISFNQNALAVERIETDGSVLSLWPTPPEFSNTKGTIRFSGTADSGFTSREALLVRIFFRPVSVMPGDVQIDSGAILLNDARATNIITTMQSGLYTITPHRTQPEPASATNTPDISAEPAPEVKGVSIQVPSILGFDDTASIGERIILQGTAGPDTTIHILLQHERDTPYESTVLTARDGSFTYASTVHAEAGVYRAWAEVRTGSETFTSNTVVITVRARGFAAAALAPVLTFGIPALVLLVAGLFVGRHFYARRSDRSNY